MEHPLITVVLRGQLDYLQPAQRRVAEVVLAAPERVAGLSIAELAAETGASAATILRLCRALGLDGYRELRLALASEAGRRDGNGTHSQGDIGAGDDLASVVRKIAALDAQAVRDTADTLDIGVLERVIGALAGAPRVIAFGVGASAIVAADLQQKFTRIGRTALAFNDAHLGITSLALLDPGDVAVVVSHSGATTDTLDALLVASRRGATTVAITNSPTSPIAVAADHVLLTAARESVFRSGATASRLAQLVVVDCVFVGLAQRTFAESQAALEATYQAVRKRPTRT